VVGVDSSDDSPVGGALCFGRTAAGGADNGDLVIESAWPTVKKGSLALGNVPVGIAHLAGDNGAKW
jgi:hypothetical protein